MSEPDTSAAGSLAEHREQPLELPWLATQCEQLRRARALGRLAPALLIHDPGGLGGGWLAQQAAMQALCRARPEGSCARCRDCRLVRAGQHPDLFTVNPEGDSRLIRVEQVRELSAQLALSAHGGGASVAIISPAEAMNANAANALLKTLEEPRPGAILVLVTSAPSRLPATVISRCQRLPLRAPPRGESLAWLERQRGPGDWAGVLDLVGEAPLRALEIDPAQLARLRRETDADLRAAAGGRLEVARTAVRWTSEPGLELRLACLEKWLTGRIESALGGSGSSSELRSGAHRSAPASDINTVLLLRVLDGAYRLRASLLTSINRALALEQLLWELPRAFRAAPADSGAAPATVR